MNPAGSAQRFLFEVIHTSKRSKARVGRIHTPHGIIETPSFVPVATNASLKSVDHTDMLNQGIQLMFCNTFHLLLHPGPEIIKQAGGLHKFMNYPRPIITDSGGFQAFSLSEIDESNEELKGKGGRKYENCVMKISEEGIVFRSYRDGHKILLTPESSVECQKSFGSDIIIPLDELPAYNVSKEQLKESFDRTHRWQQRSLRTHLKNPNNQAMYSVIHGGVDRALRKESIATLAALPFDGYAIGGSIEKNRDEMANLLEYMVPLLPPRLPIHLLGIGDDESLDTCVRFGIDTFDSAYPCKSGRHGNFFTSEGTISIRQTKYLTEHNRPIDPECTCHTCTNYSLGYLHHLYKAKEHTLFTLGTTHNLHYTFKKMARIREKIMKDEI
eukprot:TRINITY_DN1393_c0_g1_i4.p1 TRINITY_DN1393_c0_g1~~TRINITY_DN1393_c0_g1_i4.p1  ORF type:complete len:385 (-),score=20.25 TRINITY_DN1393_c0_g1_i4:220-1374(-)